MKSSLDTQGCAAVRGLLLRRPDGDLTPTDEARLRAHLSRCAACAREAERRSQVGALLRRDPLPLDFVRLPSGEELARSVVEAAQGRDRIAGSRLRVRWAIGAVAGLAVAVLMTRAPAVQTHRASAPVAIAVSAPPSFWIDDDERSGRAVLMDTRPVRPDLR